MQIILKQRDIEQALHNYLKHMGINLANKTVTMDFTAGRGAAGISAEIDIEDADMATLQPATNVLKAINEKAAVTEEAKVADAPAAVQEEPAEEETPVKTPVSGLFS